MPSKLHHLRYRQRKKSHKTTGEGVSSADFQILGRWHWPRTCNRKADRSQKALHRHCLVEPKQRNIVVESLVIVSAVYQNMPHLPLYGTRLAGGSPWMVQQPHHHLVLVKSAQYKQMNTMTGSCKLHKLHNNRRQSVIAVSVCWTYLIRCNKDVLQKLIVPQPIKKFS